MKTTFWKSGHAPTLFAAFLYFDLSFMVWVMLGPLGVQIAKDLTDGYGADVYLEATGHPAAVPQGLNLLRKLGRYVEYGVFGSDVTVDWSIISDDKELDVLGAHLGPYCWPAAIQMIENGVLPMNDICTHQLPLTEFQKGLDLVASGQQSVKVSLIPA